MAGILGWGGGGGNGGSAGASRTASAASERSESVHGTSARPSLEQRPSDATAVGTSYRDSGSLGPLAYLTGARRESSSSSIVEKDDEEQEIAALPFDPDLNIFESTAELVERLDNMAPLKGRHGQVFEHVSVAEVEAVLDELKEEKEQDETILAEVNKIKEMLAKNTVAKEGGSKQDRKLTAARMVEIENRLQMDPSLKVEQREFLPDNAAAMVKRSLIRTYGKIKKSDHDLSAFVINALDERIQTLKDL